MNTRYLALMSVALLGGVSSASTYICVPGQTDYPVSANGTASVEVYLQETFSGVSQLVSEKGIYGYDLEVTRTVGSAFIAAAAANSAQFTSVLSVSYNPNPIPLSGSATVDLSVSALDNPGPEGSLSGNTRSILLGTFTIQAGSSGQSRFSTIDSTFFGTNTITNSGSALDSTILPGSFTITVVPEPAMLGLIATGGLLLLRRRRA